MVLSDDLVWAYSREAGGPLDPNAFSIQLPQSTVLKTAQYVLTALGASNTSTLTSDSVLATKKGKGSLVYKQHLLNYGRPLPGGVSVLTLLQEIAEEDRVAAEVLALNGDNTTQLAPNSRHIRARRLSDESLTTSELQLLRSSNRYLLQQAEPEDALKPAWAGKGVSKSNNKGNNKVKATPGASVKKALQTKVDSGTDGLSNTLIRLLQKVSPQDIARLQEGVRNVSKYFQFYALNDTLRTDVTPPAVHMYPAGGALEMLDHALEQRKKTSPIDIYKRCVEEKTRPGHKYIGNYPCEKRR